MFYNKKKQRIIVGHSFVLVTGAVRNLVTCRLECGGVQSC